jgi:hypothetical protein
MGSNSLAAPTPPPGTPMKFSWMPTGIFYAQSVKTIVLFFDRKPAQDSKIVDLQTAHQPALHPQFAAIAEGSKDK